MDDEATVESLVRVSKCWLRVAPSQLESHGQAFCFHQSFLILAVPFKFDVQSGRLQSAQNRVTKHTNRSPLETSTVAQAVMPPELAVIQDCMSRRLCKLQFLSFFISSLKDKLELRKSLLQALYGYIRAGRLSDAVEVCRRAHEPWRAASIRGSLLSQWKALGMSYFLFLE